MRIIKHIVLGMGVLALFLTLGCSPAPKSEAPKVKTVIVDTVQTAPQTLKEKIPEFRNCRAILAAHEYEDRDSKETALSFKIMENPDYDPALGDACKGNLANLWQDLEQYDDLIEKHDKHISGFPSVATNLHFFPKPIVRSYYL